MAEQVTGSLQLHGLPAVLLGQAPDQCRGHLQAPNRGDKSRAAGAHGWLQLLAVQSTARPLKAARPWSNKRSQLAAAAWVVCCVAWLVLGP